MGNQKKWTACFLLRSVDTSILQAINLIIGLRKIDFGKDIQVVLCLNIFKGAIPFLTAKSFDPKTDTFTDLSFTTVFYALQRNEAEGSSTGFWNDLLLLAQKDDFDIDNPEDITQFFKIRVLDQRPAERFVLFTWDHGNGYSIFRVMPEGGDSTRQKIVAESLPASGPVPGKVLTMDQLAIAIELALPHRKLDLLVMLNCAMQSFDAGYALRKAVKYLVAPETDMDFAAYNYTYFFRKLAKDPDMSTKTWARCIVNSVETTLYDPLATGVAARSTLALFAMDLKYYQATAVKIDEVAYALKLKWTVALPEIQMALGITMPVSSSVFLFDFFFLLDNLAKTLGEDWEHKLRKSLLSLRKKMIIAQYIGSFYRQHAETPNPAGFSVIFPMLINGKHFGADILTFFEMISKDSFTREREWNKFVLRSAGDYPPKPEYIGK